MEYSIEIQNEIKLITDNIEKNLKTKKGKKWIKINKSLMKKNYRKK